MAEFIYISPCVPGKGFCRVRRICCLTNPIFPLDYRRSTTRNPHQLPYEQSKSGQIRQAIRYNRQQAEKRVTRYNYSSIWSASSRDGNELHVDKRSNWHATCTTHQCQRWKPKEVDCIIGWKTERAQLRPHFVVRNPKRTAIRIPINNKNINQEAVPRQIVHR